MSNELGELIKVEVARAEADFAGCRSRALTVVGVAGGLVALVSGFLALAGLKQGTSLPLLAKFCVGLALAAFILATIFALLTNLPSTVQAVSAEKLRALVDGNWGDDDWDQSVAKFSLTYLASLRAANATGTSHLRRAIVFEVSGIALTGLMAISVITQAL